MRGCMQRSGATKRKSSLNIQTNAARRCDVHQSLIRSIIIIIIIIIHRSVIAELIRPSTPANHIRIGALTQTSSAQHHVLDEGSKEGVRNPQDRSGDWYRQFHR